MRSRIVIVPLHLPAGLGAPRAGAVPPPTPMLRVVRIKIGLGSRFVLDRRRCVGVADRDAARLHRLRHLPYEIDRQQTVLEPGAADLDILGEAKTPLEAADRNAAIEKLRIIGVALLGAGDDEHGLL